MSEPAAEKKKGGKLPIIIGLVVVLAAGGYFGLNKGGKDAKKEPEAPKLTAIMDLGEFTVNLKGGTNFLRAKVAVHCDASIDAAHGAESYGAPLQDIIITVLSDYTMEEVLSPAGKNELRRRLAYEMNHRMHLVHQSEEEEKSSDDEKEKEEGEEGEEHAKEDDHSDGKPWMEKPKYPELDSDKGPILKVYLTDFAMQ